MTTRETSREAYRQLLESGELPKRQADALAALIEHGPATSAEIIVRYLPNGLNVNLWRARFTELAARGLIEEVDSRRCKVTGRTALVWQYSGRTQPLAAKHRTSAKAWKAIAERACKLLAQSHTKAGGGYLAAQAVIADAKAAGASL